MDEARPPPVRTCSGPQPAFKVVGFQEPCETSPASVLRFREDDSPSPSSARRRSQLGETLQHFRVEREAALPRLSINIKKSKSFGDLLSSRAAGTRPLQISVKPSSPPQQQARSHDCSVPLRIPCDLPRRQTWTGPQIDEEVAAAISAASSLASYRGPSPTHLQRSLSTREMFEAQADIVTAQAQVAGLHSALKREHDEVVRLREQLSAVTAERDRLLQELGEGATPRVFDMEDACALRGPFH